MAAGCGGLTRTRKQITPTANAGQKSWVGRFLTPPGPDSCECNYYNIITYITCFKTQLQHNASYRSRNVTVQAKIVFDRHKLCWVFTIPQYLSCFSQSVWHLFIICSSRIYPTATILQYFYDFFCTVLMFIFMRLTSLKWNWLCTAWRR